MSIPIILNILLAENNKDNLQSADSVTVSQSTAFHDNAIHTSDLKNDGVKLTKYLFKDSENFVTTSILEFLSKPIIL